MQRKSAHISAEFRGKIVGWGDWIHSKTQTKNPQRITHRGFTLL